jgi:hypothetical protein
MKYNAFGKKIFSDDLVHETWDSGQARCGHYSAWQPPLTVDNTETTTCLRCVVLCDKPKS